MASDLNLPNSFLRKLVKKGFIEKITFKKNITTRPNDNFFKLKTAIQSAIAEPETSEPTIAYHTAPPPTANGTYFKSLELYEALKDEMPLTAEQRTAFDEAITIIQAGEMVVQKANVEGLWCPPYKFAADEIPSAKELQAFEHTEVELLRSIKSSFYPNRKISEVEIKAYPFYNTITVMEEKMKWKDAIRYIQVCNKEYYKYRELGKTAAVEMYEYKIEKNNFGIPEKHGRILAYHVQFDRYNQFELVAYHEIKDVPHHIGKGINLSNDLLLVPSLPEYDTYDPEIADAERLNTALMQTLISMAQATTTPPQSSLTVAEAQQNLVNYLYLQDAIF
jgi:hypothetical protein